MNEPMRPWSFDPKGNGFQPPRTSDDDAEPSSKANAMAVIGGLAAVGLLSFAEGTLAWIGLEHVEDIGWISTHVGWSPIVAIAVCVNLIRAFDRAVFRRD